MISIGSPRRLRVGLALGIPFLCVALLALLVVYRRYGHHQTVNTQEDDDDNGIRHLRSIDHRPKSKVRRNTHINLQARGEQVEFV